MRTGPGGGGGSTHPNSVGATGSNGRALDIVHGLGLVGAGGGGSAGGSGSAGVGSVSTGAIGGAAGGYAGGSAGGASAPCVRVVQYFNHDQPAADAFEQFGRAVERATVRDEIASLRTKLRYYYGR